MINQENYYIPPSDQIFEEIKCAAIEIWLTYDDTHGYATEKTDRIKELQNIKDNAMYIVAMFDYQNQSKLLRTLSPDARAFIVGNLS